MIPVFVALAMAVCVRMVRDEGKLGGQKLVGRERAGVRVLEEGYMYICTMDAEHTTVVS